MSNFAGGSGTQEDPYLIETREHLENIEDGNYYKQISDIDLANEHWEPLYVEDISYDGDEYKIKNLYIDGDIKPNNNGLFGWYWAYSENQEIKNIIIENSSYSFPNSGHVRYTAALAGGFDVEFGITVKIKNCHVKYEMQSVDVYNYEDWIEWNGGLIGCLSTRDDSNVLIKNCSSKSKIYGKRLTGGMIGAIELYDNDTVNIENCYAITEIKNITFGEHGLFAGALAPFGADIQRINVKNCYAIGSISSAEQANDDIYLIGGFAGGTIWRRDGDEKVSFTNCYSVCDYSGLPIEAMMEPDDELDKYQRWGFYPSAEEIAYYTQTDVTQEHIQSQNCYFDKDVGGEENHSALSRTTEEMTEPHAENTYEDWDMENIWTEITEKGYPALSFVETIDTEYIFDSSEWAEIEEESAGHIWRGWTFRTNARVNLHGIKANINTEDDRVFGAAIWQLNKTRPETVPSYENVIGEVYYDESHSGEIELEFEEPIEIQPFQVYLILCGRVEGFGSIIYPIKKFDVDKPYNKHPYLEEIYPRGPHTHNNYQRFWTTTGDAEAVSGSDIYHTGGISDSRPALGVYGEIITDSQGFLEIISVEQFEDHNKIVVNIGGGQ